jgi:aminopeptidase N
MRQLMVLAAALTGAFAGLSGAAGAAERNVLPPEVTPTHYAAHIMPDAANLAFRGEVTIDVEVTTPTDRVTLNAAELAIDSAAFDGAAAARVEIDAAGQTASFVFAQPIPVGHHTLALAWHGKISQFTSGFFAVDYDTAAGKQRLLATKFEPAAARRFMPLWDEPAIKATYTLTADVPAGQMALSNMPVASQTPLDGGLKRVVFQPSPKMSSYLLFFGVGDLERITTRVGKTEVGVLVRKGAAQKAAFALAAAKQILPYYNEYFGTPYPLPKLDLIASPGAGSFSAMENWGAIFYFENALLIDPKTSADADRQRVYTVIAHEMAHQWFGDLVTMTWWDELWLNEGFASWMEVKATDHFHPEWAPWLQTQIDRERAMRLDALPVSHPVVQDVPDGPTANQAFDSITYDKGQAVIRMLEAHLGETGFRNGVRAYMKTHAYGSSVTDDLWRALEASTKQPVKAVADGFIKQPGVPLIRVADDGGLSQERFSFDPTAQPGAWSIPVTVRALASDETAKLLVKAGPAIPAPVDAPLLANADQTAYARVAYSAGPFEAVRRRFTGLAAADQLGLLSDAWALGQAGDVPAPQALELIVRLPAKADAVVWSRALDILTEIDRLEPAGPARTAYRAWARSALATVFADIGWAHVPGEPENAGVLRERLLMLLSQFDDPAVAADAQQRFAAFVANPASLPGPLRRPLLRIVGRHADAARFEQLRKLAAVSDDPLEKRLLDEALSMARDPTLARQALAIAVTPEVPASVGPQMIRQVAVEHPDLAWAFAVGNLAAVSSVLDLRQRYQYLPGVASASSNAARADDLQALAERDYPPGARRFADQAEAEIRLRARVRAERLPQIDAWVAAQGR